SCETRKCSCNRETGSSIQSLKSPRISRAEFPGPETRPVPPTKSRNRRSPGTSEFPGRSENLSSSTPAAMWPCSSNCPRSLRFQNLFDLLLDFRLLERLALDFVVPLRVHQVFGAQHHRKLPHVHFRHEHAIVSAQNLSQIFRQRIQMPQMNVPDPVPVCALRFQGRRDRP